MIELSGVRVERDERLALRDLSLRVAERRVGVIGPNGSGKSTFLRLLNGLVLPTAGHVRVFGIDSADDTAALRARVGFVFQNPDNQIVMPSVAEDVGFGLRRRKLKGPDSRARVDAALERHGIAHLGERLVHQLSGGERQLVALAGVLVMEPDLLVLDEPTTLLDRRNKRRLMRQIEAVDRPVVLATHDLDLLESFDRVLAFDDGRIVADGAPGEAISAYERLTT